MRRRRAQLGGPASLVVLAVALSACTVIGHQPVPGWPRMEVVEHRIPEPQLRERCGKYVAFGMSPQACAEFNFATNRCDLWFSADFPPTREMIEHERLHCQGYDHIGMRTMADMLARWRGDDSASTGATANRDRPHFR